MENFLQALQKVKTIVLDVDGVMTNGQVIVMEDGQQVRSFFIKDGYAMNRAVKEGYEIVIISAGTYEGVRKRLEYLGIKDVFLGAGKKEAIFDDLAIKRGWDIDNVLYMGDDIPDFNIMKKVGLPTCPSDAAPDIKNIARYVSPANGGSGAVRDILEKNNENTRHLACMI